MGDEIRGKTRWRGRGGGGSLRLSAEGGGERGRGRSEHNGASLRTSAAGEELCHLWHARGAAAKPPLGFPPDEKERIKSRRRGATHAVSSQPRKKTVLSPYLSRLRLLSRPLTPKADSTVSTLDFVRFCCFFFFFLHFLIHSVSDFEVRLNTEYFRLRPVFNIFSFFLYTFGRWSLRQT